MAVTDDFYIDNQPGAPFRAELNTILAALATANAGSTEPPNPQPGIQWLDTSATPWTLKRRNAQNTGWITHYDTSNKPSKSDVGLSNVQNFTSTASLTDGSTSKFAQAKATKDLEDKKLDRTAVAADSAKLGGKAANSYALQTGNYSGLRAQATTKGDVGLGNVANYTASSSVTLNSNTSYALSSAVYSLNQSKLDKTAQAADAAKLGGKAPSAYALAIHSHTASELPTGTTSAPGILQLLDSVTSTSTTLAAVPKSVKTAYDKGNQALGVANTAKSTADKALPKAGGDLSGTLNYTTSTGNVITFGGKTVLERHTAASALSFGADEGVVIGSGESRALTAQNVSMTSETLHLSSDNTVIIRSNLQSGWASRKEFVFEQDGGFRPGNVSKTRQNLSVPASADVYNKTEVYTRLETLAEIDKAVPEAGYALLDFGTINKNSRYVQANPFGSGVPFITLAEVQINNVWFDPSFYCQIGSGDGFGARSGPYDNFNNVVVQTGASAIIGWASRGGNTGNYNNVLTTAPCRVHCWRLEA